MTSTRKFANDTRISKKMISIIVIEYHSLDDIKKCMASIRANCADMEYEVIVSSNSCYPKDKQDEIIRDEPEVRWVFNDHNGGFGYGMNQGLKVARGEYLVIMNPDVRLRGSLSILSSFLSSHSAVGAIAPQIVGHNDEIQDSCRQFVTPFRFVARQLRRIVTSEVSIVSKQFDYSKIQTVDCLIGACIMVSRVVYEKVGGLDDAYFMYAEDIDWCTRIWIAGHQVVYCPLLQVEYEGSRSARTNKKYAGIFIKSHLRYWRKFGFVSLGYPKNPNVVFG